jgi:hypothetical protein
MFVPAYVYPNKLGNTGHDQKLLVSILGLWYDMMHNLLESLMQYGLDSLYYYNPFDDNLRILAKHPHNYLLYGTAYNPVYHDPMSMGKSHGLWLLVSIPGLLYGTMHNLLRNHLYCD